MGCKEVPEIGEMTSWATLSRSAAAAAAAAAFSSECLSCSSRRAAFSRTNAASFRSERLSRISALRSRSIFRFITLSARGLERLIDATRVVERRHAVSPALVVYAAHVHRSIAADPGRCQRVGVPSSGHRHSSGR